MANNKIQIKRSTANAVVSGLSNGELAFTQASNTLWIGLPDGSGAAAIAGVRNPGTLTANQALVANASSAIDKVIVANLVPTQITANGSLGTSGYVLASGSSGNVYWTDPGTFSTSASGSNTQIQYNNSGVFGADSNFTYNNATGTLSVNAIAGVTNINASSLNIGSGGLVANSSAVTIGTSTGLNANGSVGSAGQVLHSNGTTVYWGASDGDITAVTAGDGLNGGGTTGDVTVSVLANNGITSNTSGVFVKAANGINVGSGGVSVASGNGVAVDSNGVRVVAGNNQVISNTSGVFIDQSKIDLSGLSGYNSNAFIDHSSVTLTAGDGLTGGGDITTSRTFDVGAGNGIEVNAIAVAVKVTNDGGLISNGSGVFVKAGTGVTVNTTGVSIGQAVGTTDNVTFANIVTTDLTTNGNTVLGSDTSDRLTVNGLVSSNLMPSANNTYYVGNNTLRWAEGHFGNVHSNTGYFDGRVEISGDLIVAGNVTTVNVNSVIVSDPMIYLAGNNYSSDLVDIGFAGNYNDGTNRHTGLFRDHTDGVWKLFYNLTQELSGNNDIDVGDATYRTATLETFLQSGGLSTNSTSANLIANSTYAVGIVANSLLLSTALATNSGGTGLSSITNNALLVGNSTSGFDQLSLGTSGYVLQSNGTSLVYDTLDGGTF